MEFTHAGVQTGQFRVVVAAIAVIPRGSQNARKIRISRGDHSALACD